MPRFAANLSFDPLKPLKPMSPANATANATALESTSGSSYQGELSERLLPLIVAAN